MVYNCVVSMVVVKRECRVYMPRSSFVFGALVLRVSVDKRVCNPLCGVDGGFEERK